MPFLTFILWNITGRLNVQLICWLVGIATKHRRAPTHQDELAEVLVEVGGVEGN